MEPGTGIDMRYLFAHEVYHGFVEGKLNSNEPQFLRLDLEVALSCGFIFYKGWMLLRPAINKCPDVPFIFAKYCSQGCQLD